MSNTDRFKPGDESKGICEKCQRVVETTFGYTNTPFEDGAPLKKGFLVANCDDCGTAVGIPAQSIVEIQNLTKG